MIVDRIENSGKHEATHPDFRAAFDFLRRADLKDLPDGRHEIRGPGFYAGVDRKQGKGRDAARLEAHRAYIDIQFTIEGSEFIGWKHLSECEPGDAGYAADRDIEFFEDRPEVWVPVPPGTFAIFFPEDAHAPLAGEGSIHKVVVKVPAGPFRLP